MDGKDLTIEQIGVIVAACGVACLLGFTILVLASDGLRWYKLRLARMKRLDGTYYGVL